MPVGLVADDGGVGVVVGFIVAVGIPWLVLWPAMRWSGKRRGFRMTMQYRDL